MKLSPRTDDPEESRHEGKRHEDRVFTDPLEQVCNLYVRYSKTKKGYRYWTGPGRDGRRYFLYVTLNGEGDGPDFKLMRTAASAKGEPENV